MVTTVSVVLTPISFLCIQKKVKKCRYQRLWKSNTALNSLGKKLNVVMIYSSSNCSPNTDTVPGTLKNTLLVGLCW